MDENSTPQQQELFPLLANNAPDATAQKEPFEKVVPIPIVPGSANRKPGSNNAGQRKSSKRKTVAQKMAGRANARSEAGQSDRIEVLLTFDEGQALRKFASEEGICVRRIGPVIIAGVAAFRAARGRKEQK